MDQPVSVRVVPNASPGCRRNNLDTELNRLGHMQLSPDRHQGYQATNARGIRTEASPVVRRAGTRPARITAASGISRIVFPTGSLPRGPLPFEPRASGALADCMKTPAAFHRPINPRATGWAGTPSVWTGALRFGPDRRPSRCSEACWDWAGHRLRSPDTPWNSVRGRSRLAHWPMNERPRDPRMAPDPNDSVRVRPRCAGIRSRCAACS